MNKIRLKNNNKGVTLIELIIVIGIFALILTIAGSGFLLGLNSFSFVAGEVYDHQNLNLATTSIIREARVASLIEMDDSDANVVSLTITRSNNTQVKFEYVISEEVLYKNGFTFTTGITEFTAVLSDLDNDATDDLLVIHMAGLDDTNAVNTSVRSR